MLRTTRIQVAAVVAMLLAAGTVAAQQAVVRSLQGGGVAQPVVVRSGQGLGGQGYVSLFSGSIRWLNMESVKKDLELTNEQTQKINQIRMDIQKESSEAYKKMGDLSLEERRKQHNELNTKLLEKMEDQIKEALLPEQKTRLDQVMLQMKLRDYYGVAGVLSGDDLAKTLGITDSQRKELLRVQQEVQKEMQKKMSEFQAKIREEAQKKILGVLTKRQRDKLETMKGDKLEYQYQRYQPPSSKK